MGEYMPANPNRWPRRVERTLLAADSRDVLSAGVARPPGG